MNTGRMLVLIGACGLIFGALLPWTSTQGSLGSTSRPGFEGDGIVTGAIGFLLLIIAMVVKGKPGKRYSTGTVLLSMVAALLLYIVYSRASALIMAANAQGAPVAQVGAGIYVSAISVILTFIGGLYARADIKCV